MRLFRVGRMIDRLLLMGVLVGAALLLFLIRADDNILNKVRDKIGVPVMTGNVVQTGVATDTQNGNQKF